MRACRPIPGLSPPTTAAPRPFSPLSARHVRAVAHRATAVRAKFYALQQREDGEAEEQLLDYSQLLPILHDSGFDGWLSIVYVTRTSP